MTDTTGSADPASRTGRLPELDALRGIAATCVLMYHYTSIYPRLVARTPFHHVPQLYFGYFGVELFFMISGFVIFFSVGRSRSVRDFALSRFSRLFPAYWTAVLLTIGLGLAFGHVPFRASLPQDLANLTMLQTFLGFPDLDGSYWTLALELSFYGWIVLAIRAAARTRVRIEWLLLGYLATIAAIRDFGIHIPFRVSILILQNYGQLFVFGTSLFILYSGKGARVTYATAIAALAVCGLGANPDTQANGFVDYAWGCLACAALMLVAVWRRPRVLSTPVLQFMGRISYPLYLVHSAVGFLVIDRALAATGNEVLALGLAAGVSILVAYLLNVAIEVPGRLAIARVCGLHRPSVPQ